MHRNNCNTQKKDFQTILRYQQLIHTQTSTYYVRTKWKGDMGKGRKRAASGSRKHTHTHQKLISPLSPSLSLRGRHWKVKGSFQGPDCQNPSTAFGFGFGGSGGQKRPSSRLVGGWWDSGKEKEKKKLLNSRMDDRHLRLNSGIGPKETLLTQQ